MGTRRCDACQIGMVDPPPPAPPPPPPNGPDHELDMEVKNLVPTPRNGSDSKKLLKTPACRRYCLGNHNITKCSINLLRLKSRATMGIHLDRHKANKTEIFDDYADSG